MTETTPLEVTEEHQRILDKFADFTDTLVTYVQRGAGGIDEGSTYMMHAGALLFALTLLPTTHAALLEELDLQANTALDAAFASHLEPVIEPDTGPEETPEPTPFDPKVPSA